MVNTENSGASTQLENANIHAAINMMYVSEARRLVIKMLSLFFTSSPKMKANCGVTTPKKMTETMSVDGIIVQEKCMSSTITVIVTGAPNLFFLEKLELEIGWSLDVWIAPSDKRSNKQGNEKYTYKTKKTSQQTTNKNPKRTKWTQFVCNARQPQINSSIIYAMHL